MSRDPNPEWVDGDELTVVFKDGRIEYTAYRIDEDPNNPEVTHVLIDDKYDDQDRNQLWELQKLLERSIEGVSDRIETCKRATYEDRIASAYTTVLEAVADSDLQAIVELHKPEPGIYENKTCAQCGGRWPCDTLKTIVTVRAIEVPTW